VRGFSFKNENAEAYPLNTHNLQNIANRINQCMTYAKANGLGFIFTPHIDDVSGRLWRFYFKFNPLQKYDGLSYEDLILALSPVHRTHYFLTAELKTSYTEYHREYYTIAQKLKEDHWVGHNINHNENEATPKYEYDFVGVSNYLKVQVSASPSMFNDQIVKIKKELKKLKMENLPLFYNEIGLGGAGTFYEMINAPWEGVYGEYDVQTSPWQNETKNQYRKAYYRSLLKFLETASLEGVYIWNLDSFDVQGIYPYTQGHEDIQIMKWIRDHNLGD
jgi:hypothetical protein